MTTTRHECDDEVTVISSPESILDDAEFPQRLAPHGQSEIRQLPPILWTAYYRKWLHHYVVRKAKICLTA